MKNTIFEPEERIASVISADQNTPGGQRGAMFFLAITSAPATQEHALELSLEWKDPASGEYVPAPGAGAGTLTIEVEEVEAGVRLKVLVVPSGLPRTWRVKVTHQDQGDPEGWVYSVGASPLQ